MSIQLIVGLANPGKDYALTRHNAGGWFVEALAQQFNASLRVETKYHGLHATAKIAGDNRQLLIPTTYMNLSGRAIRACMDYYKISSENILVAHDDMDLPVGIIRLKFDGGDGGHNGLKDTISHLATKKFHRLRIGIGRPNKNVIDYVLEKPSKSDRIAIDQTIQDAQDVIELICRGDMQKAMQQLHTIENNKE